jgi:hypothetical protein
MERDLENDGGPAFATPEEHLGMNKLPHSETVRHHAWSDDPARDRAVRLAEDGVERRPTLEECIAGVFNNKGESMSGLRTERVTLEIGYPFDFIDASTWDWGRLLEMSVIQEVRVVPNTEIDAERDGLRMEIGCLTEENGKLRRNLEAAEAKLSGKESALRWCAESMTSQLREIAAERDALAARVKTLGMAFCEDTGERASEDGRCPTHGGDACLVMPEGAAERLRRAKARVAELENCISDSRRLMEGVRGPAYEAWIALGKVIGDEWANKLPQTCPMEREAPAAEPVAFGVIEYQGGPIIHTAIHEDEARQYKGHYVPLFSAPPPPPEGE